MTGPVGHIEPGAIVFLPETTTTGMTEEEAYRFLSGGTLPPLIDGQYLTVPPALTAAADTQTGAMIAFIPTTDSVIEIMTAVPNGESLDQLHITAAYLGDA